MDPSVAVSASEALIKQGILGIVIVLLLIALGVLWKAYTSANDARMKANEEDAAKYMLLLEKVMGALNDNNVILKIVQDRMGNRQA